MIISLHQPLFAPYFPHWQQMFASNYFVYYDSAQMMKGHYVNRNNIWHGDKVEKLTIPLQAWHTENKIKDVYIASDFNEKKFFKSLEREYKKAPYFEKVTEAICWDWVFDTEKILGYQEKSLFTAIYKFNRGIWDYLLEQPKTHFTYVSSLLPTLQGENATDKVIEIVSKVKDQFSQNPLVSNDSEVTYLNAIGGKELYQTSDFEQKDIKLKFFKGLVPEYKDFRGRTCPGLSILDILFNVSKEQILEWLPQYELID